MSKKVHNDKKLIAPFMIMPKDYGVASLKDMLATPVRVKQNAPVRTLGSFIKYLEKFNIKDTGIILSDPKTTKFKAIIDYHKNAEAPDFCEHVVDYNCEHSREWVKWLKSNETNMTQVEFADFLEDRASDVVTPSGAELLEIALKFHVVRKAVFGSAITTQSGEFQFQYSEDNQKGTIEIPNEITIGIAPFHNGESYKVKARLRYRLSEGFLSFKYILIDPEKVVEDAFGNMVKDIEKSKIKMPIFESVLT